MIVKATSRTVGQGRIEPDEKSQRDHGFQARRGSHERNFPPSETFDAIVSGVKGFDSAFGPGDYSILATAYSRILAGVGLRVPRLAFLVILLRSSVCIFLAISYTGMPYAL